ncbi:MAG: hypothetical protein AB4426_18700 [Xenococcaceae cyanobacterium]
MTKWLKYAVSVRVGVPRSAEQGRRLADPCGIATYAPGDRYR